MSTKVWKIIMGVSLVAIVVSGIAVFTLSREYADGINQYKNLEQYVDIEAEPATDEEAVETDATEETPIISLNIDVDFEKLKSINEDFKGWLYYEPLDLSYPIVRGNDNDYYTKYTFEKEQNSSGAIFMDFLNKPDFSDLNVLIYGHNMRNGTMFGSTKKLLNDTSIIDENPYFYIITEDEIRQYRIFATYITGQNSQVYDLIKTEEAQQELLDYIAQQNTYKCDVEVTPQDKIVTLSTCHGLHSSNRTIIEGVLVAEQKN